MTKEAARSAIIIDAECNKCGDCAKFGNDCSAGDADGNEDLRACCRFAPGRSRRSTAKMREAPKRVTCTEDALAAKDAEIERLKTELNDRKSNCNLNHEDRKKARRVSELSALVRELADAASENMMNQCGHCDLRDACQEGEDGIVVPCNGIIKLREALKKAREMVK